MVIGFWRTLARFKEGSEAAEVLTYVRDEDTRRFYLKRVLMRVYRDDGTDYDRTRRARLQLYVLLGIPAVTFFMINDILRDSPWSALVLLCSLLLQVAAWRNLYVPGRLRFACQLLMCAITVVMATSHLWDGQAQSMSLWLIPLLPMTAALLLGTRAALVHMGFASAIIVGAMVLSSHVHFTQRVQATEFQCLALRIVSMVFFGFSAMLSMNVTRNQRRLLHAQQREVDKIRREHEAATASKSTFFASVSHEIRTPMNGILGMTQFLRDSVLPERARASVTMMHRCAGELIELLNQILDLSALEMRDARSAPESINLAEQARIQLKLMLEKSWCDLKYFELQTAPDLAPIEVNKEVLSRTLSLILECAADNCSEGRVQVVTRQRNHAKGHETELCVIYRRPSGDIPKAANDLKQAHHSDAVRTANVALSIAAQLVPLMGAQLEVHSDPNTNKEHISLLFPRLGSTIETAKPQQSKRRLGTWFAERTRKIAARLSASKRSETSLILSAIHLVVAPGSIGFFIDASMRGYWIAAGVLTLALLLLASAVYVNYRNRNTNLASWLSVASTMSIMALINLSDGQIRSESLWILPTVSMGTLFVLGKRAFVAVFTVSVILLLAVFMGSIYLPLPQEYEESFAYLTVLRLLNLQIFGGVCIVASVASQRFSQRYRAQRVAMLSALGAAERAHNEKSKFLTNMSHEIRTPMNGILGLAEDLIDQGLPTAQHQAIRTIHRCGGHLLSLLGNVLDLTGNENKTAAIARIPFSLNEVLSDVEYLFKSKADIKGLSIRSSGVTSDLRVIGDPTRLMQVLSNLVGNAVKFSDQGEIEIALTRSTPSIRGKVPGYDLSIEVRDQGIGIEASKMGELFRSFVQIEASHGPTRGGTGLGLAISRKLMLAMGGDLKVRSEFGRGSVFELQLWLPNASGPSMAATPPDTAPASPERAQDQPRKILVVDDNAINLKVASAALQRMGYEIQLAKNGQEAIDSAQETRFDAILMDVRMPGVDGLEATRAIRAGHGASKSVPILALTADSYEEQKQLCLEAGMNAHLAKPFRAKELQATLSALWDNAAQARGDAA